MKRLFTVLLLGAGLSASAQKTKMQKVSIAAGPVLSFTTGELNITHSVGIGAEVQASIPVASNFEGFAQAGFQSFIGKRTGIGSGKFSALSHVPVLIGARYAANGLLAGLGIGYGSYSGSGGSSGGFAISPQIGYAFGRAQLIAHYTNISVSGGSLGYMGLKLYYVFN